MAGEEGEKTIAYIESLPQKVKELLQECDKNQQTIADQLRTIHVANMTLEEVR